MKDCLVFRKDAKDQFPELSFVDLFKGEEFSGKHLFKNFPVENGKTMFGYKVRTGTIPAGIRIVNGVCSCFFVFILKVILLARYLVDKVFRELLLPPDQSLENTTLIDFSVFYNVVDCFHNMEVVNFCIAL